MVHKNKGAPTKQNATKKSKNLRHQNINKDEFDKLLEQLLIDKAPILERLAKK
jgi:hypothetical protein